MANLKEIRNRISSVTSTMKITSAMKMVSAAKLKKAQDAITAMRPYSEKLTDLMSNFSDIISIRIAVGSGVAFFIAQNLDVQIFDALRKKIWYVAPLASSIIGSVTDTFLFFSIAFYATGIPWVTLAFGDLAVKLFITLVMLIPFRLLINKIKDFSESSVSEIKN